jgi:hypothetical protein
MAYHIFTAQLASQIKWQVSFAISYMVQLVRPPQLGLKSQVSAVSQLSPFLEISLLRIAKVPSSFWTIVRVLRRSLLPVELIPAMSLLG